MVPRASRVPAGPRVTGLVLAAGGSMRLGSLKQLLDEVVSSQYVYERHERDD
jgi:hypothetical protein